MQLIRKYEVVQEGLKSRVQILISFNLLFVSKEYKMA